MAVVIPNKIKREIGLIDKGVLKIKTSKPKPNREDLLKRAMADVALLNEIAITEPVAQFLLDHIDILIIRHSQRVVLTRRRGGPHCLLRYDPEGSPSEYCQLADPLDLQFHSDSEVAEIADLNERKIKKIILEWLGHYREHLPQPAATS